MGNWLPIVGLLAERTGLEPATPCVTGRYSNQLNYHSVKLYVFLSINKAKTHLIHTLYFLKNRNDKSHFQDFWWVLTGSNR